VPQPGPALIVNKPSKKLAKKHQQKLPVKNKLPLKSSHTSTTLRTSSLKKQPTQLRVTSTWQPFPHLGAHLH
jgi:hypothetical protein